MNSPNQIYAEVVNGSSSFLDQLNKTKSQIQSPDHATAGYAMCVSSGVVHNSKSGQTRLGSSFFLEGRNNFIQIKILQKSTVLEL